MLRMDRWEKEVSKKRPGIISPSPFRPPAQIPPTLYRVLGLCLASFFESLKVNNTSILPAAGYTEKCTVACPLRRIAVFDTDAPLNKHKTHTLAFVVRYRITVYAYRSNFKTKLLAPFFHGVRPNINNHNHNRNNNVGISFLVQQVRARNARLFRSNVFSGGGGGGGSVVGRATRFKRHRDAPQRPRFAHNRTLPN